MVDKAQGAVSLELSDGAEYKVLANLFGVLLACAGLLSGTMFRERSLDYWADDIMPLVILLFCMRGLLMSSIRLIRESVLYAEQQRTVKAFLGKQHEVLDQLPGELSSAAPKASSKQGFSEDEVLEAVSKRIEQQREKAAKSNKFAN